MKENGLAVYTISRSSIIHHTSSSSSSDSISLPAASTSIGPERRNVLQRENYSRRSGTGRIAVVDRKPKILQWEVSNSGQASDSNTDRCLTGKLGSQLHETEGKWSVEKRKLHINILELLAVKNAILAFTKEKTINAIHIQTDNTTALLPRQDSCRFKQGHLEISDIEADYNYYRISPRYSEHKSRLAVSSTRPSRNGNYLQ